MIEIIQRRGPVHRGGQQDDNRIEKAGPRQHPPQPNNPQTQKEPADDPQSIPPANSPSPVETPENK